VSDETIAIEKNQVRHLSKLLILAVLVLFIAAVTAPTLIELMLYDEYGYSKNSTITHVVLPGVWSAVTMLIIVLIARTRVVDDLDFIWYRWSRSEVVKTILLIIAAPLVYYPIGFLIRKLGLPIRENLFVWADQHGLAFFITLTVFKTIIGPVLEELFWRGYIQRTLERIFGGLAAWLGQAVLFAFAHFRPFGGFVPVLSFGLIAGAWRWQRRTLVPIILAHIAINSIWCAAQWPDWLQCTKIRRSVDYVARYKDIAGIAELNPNDNAYNLYELARQSAVAIPPEYEQIKNLWPKSWSSEQHAVMSRWLSDSKLTLDYVKQGTEKPYYWPELTGKMIAETIPEFTWVKSCVFALGIRSQLYAAEGKLEPAFSDLVICLRLADQLAGRRPIISQLLALRIRDVLFGCTFMILYNTDVPAEKLEHFQKRFEQSRAEDTQTLDFKVERLFLLDAIQSMYTDDGAGNGYIPKMVLRFPKTLQPLIPPEFTEQETALLKLNRQQATILTNKFFDLLDDATVMTAWQFQNNIGGIKKELENITTKNALIPIFEPTHIKPLDIASRMRTYLDALIGTIAILRYETEKGQLPSDIQILVDEGYLEKLPQDSFSEGPLMYKQIADDFLLYSYGVDLDDDGGMPSNYWGYGEKGGDQVFWPVQESKIDSPDPIETKTQ
jgi:membrane protease YdiL (CAAX protease family)